MKKINLKRVIKGVFTGIGIVIFIFVVVGFFQNGSETTDSSQSKPVEIIHNKLTVENINTGLTTLTANAITANPENEAIMYAGTNRGIFKSIDRGDSWFAVNAGLPTPLPSIAELHPIGSERVFALDASKKLYQTIDGGNNWLLRGADIQEFALDPTKHSEKIYLLKDSDADFQSYKPVIYAMGIYTPFFSNTKQMSQKDIVDMFDYIYENQSEFENIKIIEIDFLKENPRSISDIVAPNIERESIISLLTQNTDMTWLQTDTDIYFCGEDFQNCNPMKIEVNKEFITISESLKQNDPILRELADVFDRSRLERTWYTYSGIPNIYLNLGNEFLINTCLQKPLLWKLDSSLDSLGYLTNGLFVYSHSDMKLTSGCHREEPQILEDVLFAVDNFDIESSNLLVSKDKGNNWNIFDNSLPRIESMYVTKNNDSEKPSYLVYLATKDKGILRTEIPFNILK